MTKINDIYNLFFGPRVGHVKRERTEPKTAFAKKQQELQFRADLAKKGRLRHNSLTQGTYKYNTVPRAERKAQAEHVRKVRIRYLKDVYPRKQIHPNHIVEAV